MDNKYNIAIIAVMNVNMYFNGLIRLLFFDNERDSFYFAKIVIFDDIIDSFCQKLFYRIYFFTLNLILFIISLQTETDATCLCGNVNVVLV